MLHPKSSKIKKRAIRFPVNKQYLDAARAAALENMSLNTFMVRAVIAATEKVLNRLCIKCEKNLAVVNGEWIHYCADCNKRFPKDALTFGKQNGK